MWKAALSDGCTAQLCFFIYPFISWTFINRAHLLAIQKVTTDHFPNPTLLLLSPWPCFFSLSCQRKATLPSSSLLTSFYLPYYFTYVHFHLSAITLFHIVELSDMISKPKPFPLVSSGSPLKSLSWQNAWKNLDKSWPTGALTPPRVLKVPVTYLLLVSSLCHHNLKKL